MVEKVDLKNKNIPVKLPQASVLKYPPDDKANASALIGLVLAIGLIVVALVIGSSPSAFFDVRSVLIVVFGTFMVTSISFNAEDFSAATSLIGRSLLQRETNVELLSKQLLELALIVRAKGFLELNNYTSHIRNNPFLHQGCRMLSDGNTQEEITRILGQEIDVQTRLHYKSASILRRAAEVAPAMGLIGTLIGLVQMLAFLDDPTTIGPSMAVALLTTFYGAFLSTIIFSPLATKMEYNAQSDAMQKRLIINGITSMARKENPRRLEMILNSILPLGHRIKYFE